MIFYFSATGNTRYVAEKIADRIGDSVTDIASIINEPSIPVEDRVIGFAIPTYFYGVPTIMNDFIEKLDVRSKDPYIFLVLTCGETTGNAPKIFEKMLERKGLKLSAHYVVRMVDNYVPMFKIIPMDEIEAKLREADDELELITKNIGQHFIGEVNDFAGHVPGIISAMAYPLYKHGRKTSKFTVSDACIGCGKCAKGCPIQAIEMKDKRPVWVKDKCVLCLKCVHRCPKQCIDYGKSADHGRYTNPNVDDDE